MRISLTIIASMGVLVIAPLTTTAQAAESIIRDQTETVGPNRTMLQSGIWTLGLAYVPAVVVAAESDHNGDKNLYVPVAGPWMDFANRGSCPANASCNQETVNKVLIVTDGMFQGLGALDVIGSFFLPERRIVTTTSFRVSPVRLSGNGYGFAVFGNF